MSRAAEIKLMLAKVWKHGDLTKLAARRRVSLQAISQWLNGNGDQRFAIAEALSDLEDIFTVNQDAGELIKAYIDSCCESYRKPSIKHESLDASLAELEQAESSIVIAKLRQFPKAVQLKDIAEEEKALTRYRECVERSA